MIRKLEDDFENHHSQRNLAMEVIDDLMVVKLDLMDAEKKVPQFISNAISYLKKKYVTEEQSIAQLLSRTQTKTS